MSTVDFASPAKICFRGWLGACVFKFIFIIIFLQSFVVTHYLWCLHLNNKHFHSKCSTS